MKVFLDTNVFIEYIEKRLQFDAVRQIFNLLEDGKLTGIVSSGSLYTIAYIIEQGLKRKGIYNPEKLERTREGMNLVLDLVEVAVMGKNAFRNGINNSSFHDLEDSFQYQCALTAQCDVFITINIRDFRDVDFAYMNIMTPQEFVDKYLEPAKKLF